MPQPPPNFIKPLSSYEAFALILAGAITVIVALGLRHRYGPKAIALAAFFPVPGVALFAKQFDFVGWHGFMHGSVIYQIMQRGGIPPEETLFAGVSFRYPWVDHWVLAQLSRISGVSPLVLSLIAQTFAYVAFLAAAAWLASTLTRDRVTIALATLLSGFGISIFHYGFLAGPTQRAFPPLWLEPRVIPLDKFLNITSAPIGYAAMAVAAAAAVRLVCGLGSRRRKLLLIAACTLVAALIHPLSWLGVLVYGAVAVIMLLAARKREELILAGQLALAVVIPSALAFPYLRQVGESESSDGWMGLTDSAGLLAMKAANLAFFLFAFALLAYLHRAELMRMIGERNRAVIMLLLAVAALGTAFLVVRTPDMNEYKFLLQIAPAAAAIMALSLRERLRNHRAIALVLVFLLVSPGCRTLAFRLGFGVTDPVRIEGRYQRALYPAADTLYQWVAAHTPIDAVFIARDLRMPALGRRPIYIAVNAPWRGPDGWGRSRSQLLQWHVRRSDTATKRRQQLAGAILSPTWTIPPDSVMSAIQADIPGRPIFVHADVPDVAAKLDTTPGFVRQFRNPIGSIYSYTNRSPMPVTDTR